MKRYIDIRIDKNRDGTLSCIVTVSGYNPGFTFYLSDSQLSCILRQVIDRINPHNNLPVCKNEASNITVFDKITGGV